MEEAKKQLVEENVEATIETNRHIFQVDGKTYSCVNPTTAQIQEMQLAKTREYGRLLKDKDILSKEEVDVILKSRGNDVKKVMNRLEVAYKRLTDLQILLGGFEDIEEDKIKKNKVEQVRAEIKINELLQQLSNRYNNTIETLLSCFERNWLTPRCSYVKVGDNWELAFKTIEDYESSDSLSFSLVVEFMKFYYGQGEDDFFGRSHVDQNGKEDLEMPKTE